MKPAVSAIIFDVDGVLVQSMERNYEAYRKVFEPLGIHIEQREVFANEGRRSRDLIDLLAKAHGVEPTDAQLAEMTRRHQEVFASFGPMPMYPGVEQLLRALHGNGLRLAMVTSNWRANVATHFGELTKLFDVIVSAEDVRHTKPDPEPYLKALEKLAVVPDQAVVVENAPLGIRSAVAAGLRVIAVASTNPPEELYAANVIVSRVTDVLPVLEAIE